MSILSEPATWFYVCCFFIFTINTIDLPVKYVMYNACISVGSFSSQYNMSVSKVDLEKIKMK